MQRLRERSELIFDLALGRAAVDAEDGVGRPFRGVAADDASYVRGRSAHRRRRPACDGRWHCVSSRWIGGFAAAVAALLKIVSST